LDNSPSIDNVDHEQAAAAQLQVRDPGMIRSGRPSKAAIDEKARLILLSQKTAVGYIENQLFEKIQN
jgi:hypothetical protein